MTELSMAPTLDFLHEVGTRIAAADPLHEVLDEIVDFVSELVSCDSCLIYVRDEEELVLRASKNSHPDLIDRLKLHVGEGITGWVAENREPVVIGCEASRDPRFRNFSELPEDNFEAFLSIPVVFRGRVVSVINVQHESPHGYSLREVKAIATVGHLVGAAIEMARLEAHVEVLTDKLATRKWVERAKGILQRDLGMDEEAAYGYLQRSARQRRKSMREVAEAILLADELKRQGPRQ
jgi:signal transduction protein with GAF and PtsI domain